MIFSVPLLGILIPAQEILKPTIFSVLLTNKKKGNSFFFSALHLDLAWSFIAYALLYIWSDFKSFGPNWQSCHETLKKKKLFQILSQLLECCFQLSDSFKFEWVFLIDRHLVGCELFLLQQQYSFPMVWVTLSILSFWKTGSVIVWLWVKWAQRHLMAGSSFPVHWVTTSTALTKRQK